MPSWFCCCGNTKRTYVVVGPPLSGVTSIVQSMHFGSNVTAIPTLSNSDWSAGKDATVWDIGRRGKGTTGGERGLGLDQSPETATLISEADGLVFVVDCSQPVGPTERDLFAWVVRQRGSPSTAVFVVANKQDIDGAATAGEIAHELGLSDAGFPWTCQPCVAVHPGLRARRILDYFVDGSTAPLIDVEDDGHDVRGGLKAKRTAASTAKGIEEGGARGSSSHLSGSDSVQRPALTRLYIPLDSQ